MTFWQPSRQVSKWDIRPPFEKDPPPEPEPEITFGMESVNLQANLEGNVEDPTPE